MNATGGEKRDFSGPEKHETWQETTRRPAWLQPVGRIQLVLSRSCPLRALPFVPVTNRRSLGA